MLLDNWEVSYIDKSSLDFPQSNLAHKADRFLHYEIYIAIPQTGMYKREYQLIHSFINKEVEFFNLHVHNCMSALNPVSN